MVIRKFALRADYISAESVVGGKISKVRVRLCVSVANKLQNKSFDFSLGMCEVDQKPNLKSVIHNSITSNLYLNP